MPVFLGDPTAPCYKASGTYKAFKKVRKGWGSIKPIEKVIPNKKKKTRSQSKLKASDLFY
jgi:hypothetical protein